MGYFPRLVLLIALGFFGSVFSSAASSFAQAETLRIASIDWCPQLCPQEDKEGYVLDTVKEIFKNSPYEIEVVTYSWTRAIHLARVGKVHALLSPAKPEAPDLLYPEQEVGTQKMCFFVKNTSPWKYEGITSLRDQKIGIAIDTSIEELNTFIKEHKDKFFFSPYGTDYLEHSFNMIERGRLDSFIFTYNSTVYSLLQRKLVDRIKSAGCVSSGNIYMAFTPDKQQRAFVLDAMRYFDKKMTELVRKEEIANIMRNYGLPSWKNTELKVF
ncbi:substrate-binding periplasmic protein [Kiloniella antarctica]|uniref:Substrate-binding periplasmic protein n=1 Tax=Kiloniella antarctica TaxID=1550907 RepID=A0ABW5BJ01_9PROT